MSMFGSARTATEDEGYRVALEFGRAIVARGWMVITGAGPGVMAAGHEGAGAANSFGVGIKLPHYSGSQYDMGRKIPTAQMRRGDVLFWGPGGSQHVAIYLGNNQMIEAPYTGSHVKISPVRTSGMTPYAVRYIEY